MAFRSRSFGTFSNSNTSSTAVPAGAQAGDIAILWVYGGSNVTVTPPAGFTPLTATTNVSSRGFLSWFWKRLTTAETGSWTSNLSATAENISWAALSSGRDTSANPFDFTPVVHTDSATSGAPTAIGGTATAGSDALYGFDEWNGTTSNLAPTGWVNRDDDTAGGPAFVGAHLATLDNVSAGALSAQAQSNGSNNTYWTTLAVIKAAATSETVHGSADAPLGGLASTITGHRTVHGAATAAAGGVSAVAAGRRTVRGSATAALAGLSTSLEGRRAVSGVAAAAMGGLSTAVTGHRTVHGTGDAPSGGLTAAATAKRTVHATAAATLAGVATAATGQRTVHGTVSGQIGSLVTTVNVTGGRTGTVSAPLGGLTTTATGHRKVHGSVTAELGAVDLAADALRTVHGTAAADLGQLDTAVVIGAGSKHGTVTALLGRLVTTITGHRTIHGHASAPLGGLATTITLPRNGYPDIEKTLVAWANGEYPDARVCTELPANLAQVLPVIQFGRIGGQDLQITVDRPNVDVDCYAATRDDAKTLAYNVWHKMRYSLPGTTIDGALISKVRTINAPNWAPYDNTTLRRFTFTVQLFSRST